MSVEVPASSFCSARSAEILGTGAIADECKSSSSVGQVLFVSIFTLKRFLKAMLVVHKK